MAPVALAAAALASQSARKWFPGIAMVLVLVLSVMTFRRAAVFATAEGLMRDTLAKNPAATGAHNDLGVILAEREDYAGALDHFAASLQCDPDNVEAHVNLGQVLGLQGRFAEGESHFRAALKLRPDDPATHKKFARCLSRVGKNPEAIRHLEAVVRYESKSRPDIETRLELASLLYATGNVRGATAWFRQVVSLKPDHPEALNNLAWLLATGADAGERDGAEAVRCAERACRLTGFKQAGLISTLAAAYAEVGRFPEAVAAAETALKMQNEIGDAPGAAANRQLLRFYRAGKPGTKSRPAAKASEPERFN